MHSTCLFMLTYLCFVKGQPFDSNTKHDSVGPCKPGEEGSLMNKKQFRIQTDSITGGRIKCTNGFANNYACLNVDLESFVSLDDLTNGQDANANDIWGWSKDGREFAIVGTTQGTSFVEITDPINPIVLGKLNTQTVDILWRDIKTYKDHAFIVSEATNHGLQVFDLNQLLQVSSFTIFEPTAHYSDFGRAHNIAINEDSGFAYVVGSRQGSETCNEGLHMIDISTPSNPVFAGCYGERGYTHDVQCVNYDGPDSTYSGREICFASNEGTMDIIDVSDKANPMLVSIFDYCDSFFRQGYVHQGWLTEDQRYFLIDDELDEEYHSTNTTTYIADVSNLGDPILLGTYTSHLEAIDHNQYVKGNFVYQANYRAGLRILELNDIANGNLKEFGYFDTFIFDNDRAFDGAWSNYPYFESGVVVISDVEQGLFVVRPDFSGVTSQSIRQPTAMTKLKTKVLHLMN